MHAWPSFVKVLSDTTLCTHTCIYTSEWNPVFLTCSAPSQLLNSLLQPLNTPLCTPAAVFDFPHAPTFRSVLPHHQTDHLLKNSNAFFCHSWTQTPSLSHQQKYLPAIQSNFHLFVDVLQSSGRSSPNPIMALMREAMTIRHSGPCHKAEGSVCVGALAEELVLLHDKLSAGLDSTVLWPAAAAAVFCWPLSSARHKL